MTERESPNSFRDFLTDVRVRASNEITADICESYFDVYSEHPDPADVHEDVREMLAPFFEEIRAKVEGPLCGVHVPIGFRAAAACDLLAGHEGRHHPCVGTEQT